MAMSTTSAFMRRVEGMLGDCYILGWMMGGVKADAVVTVRSE